MCRIEQTQGKWIDACQAWSKDLFQFALWIGAFAGNCVVWRGVKFRVHKGGILESIN